MAREERPRPVQRRACPSFLARPNEASSGASAWTCWLLIDTSERGIPCFSRREQGHTQACHRPTPCQRYLRAMASSVQQPLSFAPWLGAALVVMIAGCGDDGSASDSMSEATSASSASPSTTATSGTGNESESSSAGSTSDATTTTTSATSATTTTTGTSTTAATSDSDSDSSTSSTGGGQAELADLLDADLWEQMYPERNALFTYEALISAAADFPDFATQGDDNTRRRELAAFLANIAHETTGGWKDAPGGPYAWGLYFKEEVGCEMGDCVGYCDPNNVQYPCAPGVTY
ncbi:MAG TPA: hypothetical protein ENJ18_06135, partial [Nannocystis exedens]|nr:hypothetical protein [Nannocystis exedens]